MSRKAVADDVMEGGCACGRLRYRLTAAPIFVNQCHCSLCRRQGGSAFAVNLFIETAHLVLVTGDIAETTLPTGSGGEQTVLRCAACGTAIGSHYSRLGRGCAAIRAGTLDDPAAIRPDAAIFVEDRLPWVAPMEGIPEFATWYKPSDLLPPERFARLNTLMEGSARQ